MIQSLVVSLGHCACVPELLDLLRIFSCRGEGGEGGREGGRGEGGRERGREGEGIRGTLIMHVIASSNRVNLMHNCVCVYGKEEKESKRECVCGFCEREKEWQERERLTVMVQGVLEVVKVQQFVSSFADEMERILEQGQEGLEWTQNMGSHRTSLESTKGLLLYVHTYIHTCTYVHQFTCVCTHTPFCYSTYWQLLKHKQTHSYIFRSTKQERVDQIIFNTLPSNVSVLTSKPPVVCV